MSTMRKKKKCYNSCSANLGCNQKKENCCEPCKKTAYKKCEPSKKIELNCCPPGPCDDCEIKFDDTCVKLAQEAERLFKKALDCECLAVESYEEAKEFDKKAKSLEAKAKRLAKESMENETQSEKLRKQANQLLCKSEDLCERAKCLYKEAEQAGDEAEHYCEKAKCLYEKSQDANEQAKCLYSQAMKCDEKAMNCYKVAGEKIKEYEGKSKKCEDMMKKCQEKINGCYDMEDCKPKKSCYVDLGIEEPCTCKEEKPICTCKPKYVTPTYCKPKKDIKHSCGCECNYDDKQNNKFNKDKYYDLDDITLIKEEETGLYVNPIYNMEPMQYIGEFANKYPSMDEPYMYIENIGMEEMQDMWMNYYMYMQNMMDNMMSDLED